MKKFIVDFGRGLIDFSAIILLVIIFLGTIGAMGLSLGTENWFFSILYALLMGIVFFLIFVISYYLLYLFIDIRDNLEELNKNVKELNESLLVEDTDNNEESAD